MGIEEKGQVCVMIHSGSRGFGHQVATDALVAMEKAMKRDGIETNDRQLACARIMSEEGQDYLKSMAAAANFAWVNRSSMTFLSRQVFPCSFFWLTRNLKLSMISLKCTEKEFFFLGNTFNIYPYSKVMNFIALLFENLVSTCFNW